MNIQEINNMLDKIDELKQSSLSIFKELAKIEGLSERKIDSLELDDIELCMDDGERGFIANFYESWCGDIEQTSLNITMLDLLDDNFIERTKKEAQAKLLAKAKEQAKRVKEEREKQKQQEYQQYLDLKAKFEQ